MKRAVFVLMILLLAGCGPANTNSLLLQSRIDSLQSKLGKAYKPWFGEFMSGIQVHHEKLWFAGEAQNWKLANFEIDEIKEALDGIKEYNSDRPEAKSIAMIAPVIDSMSNAIKMKDPQLFKSTFISLTNTCNNCHRATDHEFNVIKIPETPPFSNQVFKVQ